jgi:hypothetical protein
VIAFTTAPPPFARVPCDIAIAGDRTSAAPAQRRRRSVIIDAAYAVVASGGPSRRPCVRRHGVTLGRLECREGVA